jgi:hypothetical protein
VAPPPDPHAGQSFTADEACGVAAYNVAIGEVCGVKATTYREGSGDVCGAVDFVLMRSSQCGVESYQERKNKACPGYDPNRRENRYASQKTLQMGSPPPLPTCAAGDEAMRQNTGLQISGWPEVETFCVKLPSCRLPEHGVDQWNECRDPAHGPVWGRCRHPNFGVESVEFAACAHPSFGIAAYNVCWH